MKKSFKATLMVVLCAGGLTAAFAFTPNGGDRAVKNMFSDPAESYRF